MPPEQDPDNDACKVPVYSTSGPGDGSETARAIRDAVRKCAHHRDDHGQETLDPETAARRAAGELAVVARLIEAADALLGMERALNEAESVIETALRHLDDEGAIQEAEIVASDLERIAAIDHARGRAAAAQARAGDPWPPVDGAEELAGLAAERLAATAELVAAAIGARDEGKLAAERTRLVSRLRALSVRLNLHR